VKLLATQTARATEQISAQIAAIQTAAGEAVGAVHGVGEAIMRMDEVAAAIAAAVEEQGAATREIAASVQAVSRQNDDATRAMRDVSDMADSATGSSQVVLAAGDEVARVSGALQEEVAQFFAAMRSTEGERRRWERISGGRARISLRPPHGAEIVGELDDISGGGASAVCTASLDVGAEVEVRLPGAGDVVPARVVRSAGRNLGVAFRQDPTSLARIDRAMDAIASLATVHAAA
jgi:methyl-accepting chemotaxis protein